MSRKQSKMNMMIGKMKLSSLALIILLDQFSRNLFRNDPKSYSQDAKARLLVTEGVDRQYLDELDTSEKFFYSCL